MDNYLKMSLWRLSHKIHQAQKRVSDYFFIDLDAFMFLSLRLMDQVNA